MGSKVRSALWEASIALAKAKYGKLTEDDAKKCLEIVDNALEDPLWNCDVGDKPFYVDVGKSVVTIRCASNSDVIMAYNYAKCPQVIQFAKDTCDMMNKEAEICSVMLVRRLNR